MRLKKKGLPKEQIKAYLIDEIRSELFKLLPKKEIEIVTAAEKREKEELRTSKECPVRMRGCRLWGDEEPQIDRIVQLEESYKMACKEAFKNVFCNRCGCNPCICRDY